MNDSSFSARVRAHERKTRGEVAEGWRRQDERMRRSAGPVAGAYARSGRPGAGPEGYVNRIHRMSRTGVLDHEMATRLIAIGLVASTAWNLFPALSLAGEEGGGETSQWARRDPHRNGAGFFDVHVCNWPQRSLFFMPLFSTRKFTDIARIEVLYPDGRSLGDLDLKRFMPIRRKGKPEKRVFMRHFDVPRGAPDGWYTVRVELRDGEVLRAEDYVSIRELPQATGLTPDKGDGDVALPVKLQWDPVKGAAYYQVFVRDKWNDGRMVFQTGIITEHEVKIPAGLLEPGGLYTWKVHARDVNGHPVLGDFNHGSMSTEAEFSIAE